jgi:Ca2+-binding EF-hand superfamily protein
MYSLCFFSLSLTLPLFFYDYTTYFSSDQVDREALASLFKEYDSGSGSVTLDGLESMLAKLGVAPLKDPLKRGSASIDTEKRIVPEAEQ